MKKSVIEGIQRGGRGKMRVSEAEPIRPSLAPSLPDADTSLLLEKARNLLRGDNGESSSCSVNSPFCGTSYKGYRSCPGMEVFLPIDDVKPGMQSWSAKVTVQEKRRPATSNKSITTYQKLVFIDANGSRVEGILFDRAIQVIGTRLIVFKKYKISNAEVHLIDEKYRADGLTVQWVISTKTVVEELPDDADMIPTKFTYTMFKELAQFTELKNQTVDILAAVISVLPITTFTNEFGPGKVQKFVIINEEKIPLQLSMFNEFIDIEGRRIAETMNNYPIIICKRLKVKFFNGVTLSTSLNSSILVDPPAHEARQLKIWYQKMAGKNAVLFAQIIKEKSYAQYNPNLFLQSPQEFTLIFYLQPNQKFAWVKASMSIQNIFQRYWYMACKKCYKAIDVSHGYPYLCNKCYEYQEAAPRCRFDVNLADRTGNITATIFGELAEKLLTHSALDAMQYFNRNAELPLEHIHEALKTKLFAVQIQPDQSCYGDLWHRYIVVHFYEKIQGEGNKSPPTSIRSNLASNFDGTDNLGETSPEASFETAQISTTRKQN